MYLGLFQRWPAFVAVCLKPTFELASYSLADSRENRCYATRVFAPTTLGLSFPRVVVVGHDESGFVSDDDGLGAVS
jgi:hypothetical protein